MLEKFKYAVDAFNALPRQAKAILLFLVVFVVAAMLSGCTQPPMKFDFLPEYTG